ncbi:Vacuolar protein sorting [Operophtera brumata]|uniref:Vacuolar protein sorting n=1 Tax=Operophtera brumata TaxID=104452 RepID=A0A0L7L0R4_OPEBR|nr:Vacuolar protein sorting [Operophtera brumata]
MVRLTELPSKDADKLFVVSRACVMVVWLGSERCVKLDAMGAVSGCSALTDKQRLTVADNNVSRDLRSHG